MDDHGWNPRSGRPVRDVGEVAALRRGRPLLRLDSGVAHRLALPGTRAATVGALVARLREELAAGEGSEPVPGTAATALAGVLVGTVTPARPAPIGRWLTVRTADRRDGWTPPRREALLRWLATGPELVAVPAPGGAGGDELLLLAGGARTGGPACLDEPDPYLVVAPAVTLAAHHRAVAERVTEIASELDLPSRVRRTLVDAARWHDVGKLEPRIQAALGRLDPWTAATVAEPLACAEVDEPLRLVHLAAVAQRLVPDQHLMPDEARHEAWSVLLVQAYLERCPQPYPGDPELLVHLVASHHGHGRPWLPAVVDPEPLPVHAELDGIALDLRPAGLVPLDQPGRFSLLNERYGRWGLALLESVLRCADLSVRAEGS